MHIIIVSNVKVHRKEIGQHGPVDSSQDDCYSLLHIMTHFAHQLFMRHAPGTLQNDWCYTRCHG